MAMLLGLVRPSAGAGTVLGEPIEEPAAYLPRVGAMVESPAFYPALSGRENLRMFATVGRHPHERDPRRSSTSSGWPTVATTATAPTRWA